MGLPAVGLVTFFSYDPWCLYPETYPEVSTMSTRPALPFPRPVSSKRSLCDPVNLVVSVRRLTVGDATALCEEVYKESLSFYCWKRRRVVKLVKLSDRILLWLLKWPVTSPRSAGTPLPQPPLQSCLYTSSWPALQAQPWTHRIWWCDWISSCNIGGKNGYLSRRFNTFIVYYPTPKSIVIGKRWSSPYQVLKLGKYPKYTEDLQQYMMYYTKSLLN